MKINKSELPYRVSAVSFALSLTCMILASFCGWSITWLWQNQLIQQLCCRLWGEHTLMMEMPPRLPVWLMVVGLLLLIGLWTMVRQAWRTSRRTSQLLSLSQTEFPLSFQALVAELGLESSVVLIRLTTPVAFCFGFWKPRICLSTALVDMLSPAQIKATLWHEEYHRQRLDPLRILLIEAAGAMFFFLPAVREWGALAKIKLELAADHYAIHQVGKPVLAGALHRLLTSPPTVIALSGAITAPGITGANAARIAELLGDRSYPRRISSRSWLHSTAAILLLCLLLMF
jgi:Zn-dependent protease with chaperone function